MKVCAEPGCPELTKATRCPAHTRAKDKARGTSTARGYGSRHRALRAEYQRRMDQGETFTCWRCGEGIDPAQWDLGHRDDRSGYEGPECYRCNRAAASRR